ncbi:MAG: hypothetical protein AB8D78_09780 [Akkermansiaceae bacterium]
MKNLCKAIAVFFLLGPCADAQEGAGWGFVNIANLIPIGKACEIRIGGETVVPDGLKGGDYTGWFMVKPGSKSMSISLGDLDEAKGNIQVTEGAGNLVAIFLEPNKRLDDEGKPLPPKIRIKSFPTYQTRGFGLKVVSLLPEKSRFQFGNKKLEAEPMKPMKLTNWNGSGFKIQCNGKPIGNVSKAEENGAFYLLVGTDLNASFASVLVSSNPQEVPEYLRPKKEKEEKKP